MLEYIEVGSLVFASCFLLASWFHTPWVSLQSSFFLCHWPLCLERFFLSRLFCLHSITSFHCSKFLPTMANSTSRWSKVTPMLLFSCFCLLTGEMLFGYDAGSYGGLLANPGFLNHFGTYNPSTKTYAFTSIRTSLMSAMPFVGKFIGCMTSGSAIERVGHRFVFFGLGAISIIGVLSSSCLPA